MGRVGRAAMGNQLRDFDAADGRRGLLEWAEPVIHDRLREAYQLRLGAGADATRLARLHGQVWLGLIAGDEANYERLRTELIGAVARIGLEVAILGRADALTLAELLDIVVLRFQRSERATVTYGVALREVAERLVARRRAA